MKLKKRFLALVLAMIMVMCMNVTAFADTVTTPLINVTVAGSRSGVTTSWSISATPGASVKSVISADKMHESDWKQVQDYYDSSISHYALESYGGYASAKFDKNNAMDVANLIAKSEYDADDIADITWYSGAYQGYGLVSYNAVTGKYTYVYAGYDWTYSSNENSQIWDYMCCYNVSSGEIVDLVYDFTVSVWTSDYPLF